MRRLELFSGLAMLAIASFIIYATSGLAYWARLVPGPGFMPFWISVLAIILSVLLIGSTLMSADEEAADIPEIGTAARLAATYAALWGIPLLSPWLGFMTASVLFMLFTLLVLYRQPLLPSLATTAVIALMVHFLFNRWLDVRLPTGIIGL